MLLVSIISKGLKSGEDNENGSPAVVEREWEMNKDFIGNALWLMELLNNVVDVRDGG